MILLRQDYVRPAFFHNVIMLRHPDPAIGGPRDRSWSQTVVILMFSKGWIGGPTAFPPSYEGIYAPIEHNIDGSYRT
jgi:hypothetical protein